LVSLNFISFAAVWAGLIIRRTHTFSARQGM